VGDLHTTCKILIQRPVPFGHFCFHLKWPTFTSGQFIQVANLYKWPSYTIGQLMQVATLKVANLCMRPTYGNRLTLWKFNCALSVVQMYIADVRGSWSSQKADTSAAK
jgi:hypothetical protein